MKIIVTGVSGFIGSHTAESLLKRGDQVLGLDNFSLVGGRNLGEFNLSFLENFKNFSFEEVNILNKNKVDKLIKKNRPDFLIHLAAKTGVRNSLENPLIYTKTNVNGTQVLLEAINNFSRDTKIILLSSSSVYGNQNELPFRESFVLDPRSPYAATKNSMEILASQYTEHFDLSIVIVRPFSIFGPRGRPDMLPFLIIRAAEEKNTLYQYGNNEDNKRDWTYVDNIVESIKLIIDKYSSLEKFEVLNIGSGLPIGLEDFISINNKLLKKYLNLNLKIEQKEMLKQEMKITFADTTKLEQKLDFKFKIDVEKGLNRFYKFYLQYRNFYQKLFKSVRKF